MRQSQILAKIRRDEAALAVCLHLTDPSVYEMAGLMGFDGIWMDLEHHAYSVETAANLMRAARAGGRATDIVARPGKGEFMRMARLLEAGATGIMYPRCSDVAEAEEVVRWAKFAPVGQRGFDGSGADAPYCMPPMAEYVAEANRQTFVLIQLEEPAALERAEAIAAVPGVDMLMLGPADFSVLTGIPGRFDHPTVDAAITKVATAARNTGKHWAATTGSVEHAKQMVDRGARLVFHGADIIMVKNGLEQIRGAFADRLGVTFASQDRAPTGDGSYLEARPGKRA
jgi:4-hydroxy-2-oxoheptanedioate aldolase